jgi:hypothetical protein
MSIFERLRKKREGKSNRSRLGLGRFFLVRGHKSVDWGSARHPGRGALFVDD